MCAKKAAGYVKVSDKLTESIEDIAEIIEQQKSTIDSIQELSLELTNSIRALHALTIRYGGIANQALDMPLPLVCGFPLVPKNVVTLLTKLESLTQKVLDGQAETAQAINDVQAGLKTGDDDKIKNQSGRLQGLIKTLTGMLPK